MKYIPWFTNPCLEYCAPGLGSLSVAGSLRHIPFLPRLHCQERPCHFVWVFLISDTVDLLHLLAGPETEGLSVCVSLLFEVGQIALTSLLWRAAGIESSFKQPLPPSTVMRLSSTHAQSQRFPRQPLIPAPGLWPSTNTQC